MSGAGASARLVLQEEREQAPLATQPFQQWVFPNGQPWTAFHRHPQGYLLRMPAFADFLVSADGRVVTARPAPGVDRETVEQLFRSQVLPLALSRQGRFVLHASAVETAGGAIAFLGASGRGKSTLAASFATAGHRFLADDGLMIEWRGDTVWARPGDPSIRLWADSREALVPAEHPVSPPLHYTDKARLLAASSLAHEAEPRRLLRLYILGPGTAQQVTIAPARPADAVRELVRHSFLLDIDEQEMLALHFDAMTRIAAHGLIYHLDYPRRYDALDAVRSAVLRDAPDPPPPPPPATTP